MPWKQLKSSTRLPARQDILIITGSLIIGLIAIAFFALKS
ncbi:hypothetical protein DSBG_2946 [Desulfosporosinus sp. BG]|nr:hypothetical protein DSBG_2946 [Desulfosporosinus sp. BG]